MIELWPLWVYLGGSVLGLVYVGARWDEFDWNDVGPLPVLGALLWPVMVQSLICK